MTRIDVVLTACPIVNLIALSEVPPVPVDVKYIVLLDESLSRVVHVEPPSVDISILHDAGAQELLPKEMPM